MHVRLDSKLRNIGQDGIWWDLRMVLGQSQSLFYQNPWKCIETLRVESPLDSSPLTSSHEEHSRKERTACMTCVPATQADGCRGRRGMWLFASVLRKVFILELVFCFSPTLEWWETFILGGLMPFRTITFYLQSLAVGCKGDQAMTVWSLKIL